MQDHVNLLLEQRAVLFPGTLGNNPCLAQFISQVALERELQLEFSRKVGSGRTSTARPSLAVVGNVQSALRRCLDRLTRYGPAFDAEPVLRFFAGHDLSRTEMLIHGLELFGADASQTRIKLHVRFGADLALRRRILDHPDTHPAVADFDDGQAKMIIGFDLLPDGRTLMRNYLSFESPEASRALLEQHWGEELARLFCSAEFVGLTWKDGAAEPFVYLIDPDVRRLVTAGGLRGIATDHLCHDGRPAYILGAPSQQWQRREFSEYNLYFMLRS
jgi:hypothetical protein